MDETESIRNHLKFSQFSHRLTSQQSSAGNTGETADSRLGPCPRLIKVTTPHQKPSVYNSMLDRLSDSTNILKLVAVLVVVSFVHTAQGASGGEAGENQNSFSTPSKDTKSSRGGKSLFFDNPLSDLYFNNQYQNEDLLGQNEEYADTSDSEDEAMSRARPLGGNKKKYDDSPIYYIRIPPSPYVHVPGYGYVSEPQNLKPPPQVVQSDPPKPNKYNSGTYNQNYAPPSQSYQRPAPQVPNYMNNIVNSLSNYMQPQQNYNYNQPTSNYNPPSSNYNPAANNYNQQTSNYNPPAPNYFSDYQNPVSSLTYQSDEYTGGGGVFPANTYPLSQGFSGGAHHKYQNSPIYNLPLQFLANGKPTHVYTLENEIQAAPMKPTKPPPPDSPIYNLDKGPYVFNGKPADIFLLRNAYNDLYDETINNFYP